MTVKVFITIDTEEDLWGLYQAENNPVYNIKNIPILQNIFNKYGAIPTYLIDYPVVKNETAMGILLRILDAGQCEIGTHCHPWNTPPFEEEIGPRNTMCCNLPPMLLRKKLETLHRAVGHAMASDPISFRAGRWGFGEKVCEHIQELGYRVDTSITPLTDWTGDHGPDFSNATPFPYWLDTSRGLSDAQKGLILEIPPTIGFLQKNMAACGRYRKILLREPFKHLRILSVLNKLRVLNYRRLSPEENTGKGMIRLAQKFVDAGHPFLNMFFHSTSLLPGKSPFVRNREDFQQFLDRIELFLQYVLKNGMCFSRLSEGLEDGKRFPLKQILSAHP